MNDDGEIVVQPNLARPLSSGEFRSEAGKALVHLLGDLDRVAWPVNDLVNEILAPPPNAIHHADGSVQWIAE